MEILETTNLHLIPFKENLKVGDQIEIEFADGYPWDAQMFWKIETADGDVLMEMIFDRNWIAVNSVLNK